MKANQKFKQNIKGFQYLIPLTLAVVVTVALLIVGGYAISQINNALEKTYPTNLPSGRTNTIYWNNATTSSYRNISLGCTVGALSRSISGINFYANNSVTPIHFNLSINGNQIYHNYSLAALGWKNTSINTVISGGNVSSSDRYLNFSWIVNSSYNAIRTRITGTYFVSSDYRATNQNRTVNLMGNVTDGFADVVDIEVVVMIITGLSMAIFSIMAIGTRRSI